MLNFVVCDDNINHNRLMAKRLINAIYEQQVIGHVALVTTDLEEVLAYSRQALPSERRNVYLLDISFRSEARGIKLAQAIREHDKLSYIVFVTAYPEYIMQSVKLKIFDYLLKPVNMQDLQKLVVNLYQDHVQTKQSCRQLVVNSGGNTYFLHTTEIIYLESYRNKVVIHCQDKTIETYASLASFEERLADEGFYRCHRSFLVNLRHVKQLDSGENLVIMSNGHRCYVARRNQKGLITYVENGS